MFSLHVDTARTWRGGQNQVLLTVNGLRAIGERSALVAHPDGELRRRAAEGLDLIPIAPRTEMDLTAAWRFARVLKRLNPDVIHAHDPHGVAMASLALSLTSGSAKQQPLPPLVASRRVDFHLKGNSFSRWKYRQVDCFIAASEAIRQMLVADGVPAERTVTVHEGIDVEHVAAAPRVNVHEAFWLPHHAPVVGNVAALVPHKGQRYLIDAAHLVVQDIPDARFIILGEGELREHLERQVREHHLEKHVLLPGFRTDVGDRRPGHLPARCDGVRAPDRRDDRRRDPRNRGGGRHRSSGAATRRACARGRDRPRAARSAAARALGTGRLRSRAASIYRRADGGTNGRALCESGDRRTFEDRSVTSGYFTNPGHPGRWVFGSSETFRIGFTS